MLARLFARKRETKYDSLDLFREVFGGRKSAAGRSVNVENALQVATVLGCVRVLADGLSQVPLKLFRESPDGKTRMPAKDHALYDVLHRQPNPWQTSYRYRETLMLHLALCGNAFSFINRVRGSVVELLPIQPGRMKVKQNADLSFSYETQDSAGRWVGIPTEAVWHLRGPSWNSWMGLEIVALARDAIGLTMAIEEQQAGLYRDGVSVPGVLSVDGNLTDDQYKKLRDWLAKEHAGSRNAGTPMILDRAAKWTAMALSSADAQTIEQRRMQIEEVCRPFRIMPIMVGSSDKAATYASAEQMFLAHVVHTLAPWYERIEQDIDVFLLTAKERRDGIYAKFVEEGLLRGAMKDTAEYLNRLTGGGIMTRNEARAKLDMNPIDGLDEPLTPTNMVAGEPPRAAKPDAGVADQLSAIGKKFEQSSRDTAAAISAALASKTQPVQVTIAEGAVKVDLQAPVTISEGAVKVESTNPVTIGEGAIQVAAGDVTVNAPVNVPQQKKVNRIPERDENGIVKMIREVDAE